MKLDKDSTDIELKDLKNKDCCPQRKKELDPVIMEATEEFTVPYEFPENDSPSKADVIK